MSGMNIKHRSSVRRAVLFFGLLVLLAGCGKETDFSMDAGAPGGSDETGPEETPKELILSLAAENTDLDLLEETVFSIVFGDDVTIARIRETYDRLEWVVKNEKAEESAFVLMDERHFIAGWGHCFHYPGRFVASLVGYRAGERVFQSDPVEVNVSAGKDFLGWNWNELPGNTTSGIGYVNVLDPELELTSVTLDDPEKKGIFVYLFNGKGEDEDLFYIHSSQTLHAYMTALYGSPAIEKETEELLAAYRTEFAYRPEHSTPLAIWRTPKSRAVLIEVQKDCKRAQIYAEPLLSNE